MTAVEALRAIPLEFRNALDASSPDDFTLRLVLADWFAEQGDFEAEEALRWSVEKRRVPSVTTPMNESERWYYWGAGEAACHFPVSVNAVGWGEETLWRVVYSGGRPSAETRSVSMVMDILIDLWRRLTKDERSQWWQWIPPEDQ